MKKVFIFTFILLSLFVFTSIIPYRNVEWINLKEVKKSDLQTGDIIIINKRIGFYGFLGHCAVYIKEIDRFAEYPVIGKGASFKSYNHWMLNQLTIKNDRKAVVLRYKDSDKKFKNDIFMEIMKTKGKKYKLVLNKDDSSGYYCSQWIWKLFKDIRSIDIDYNGGILALPYDFLLTEYFSYVKF